jgi:CRP-like cAMP-binding protein
MPTGPRAFYSGPENRLLATLPPDEYARLTARMTDTAFQLRDVVYRANGPVPYVYFPRSGVLSCVVVLPDGGAAEVGTVGNEGMAGLPAFLGADTSPTEVICQAAPCEMWRMEAAAFRAEAGRDGPFRTLLGRYAQCYLTQVGQTAACNALHGVEERLARWLLMTHDRVGADDLPLTQEFLALMLGVRRASVTVVASALQHAGLIRYQRGRIAVLDRAGLEAASCDCYRMVRAEFDRLLG